MHSRRLLDFSDMRFVNANAEISRGPSKRNIERHEAMPEPNQTRLPEQYVGLIVIEPEVCSRVPSHAS